MASGAMRGEAVLGSGALGRQRLWSGRSDRWRVAGGCVLVAATAAFAVPAYRDMKPLYEAVLGGPLAPTYALLGAAPAVVLVAAGLLAWWSHPASRIGVLLILEGVTWNLGTIVYSATYIPGGTELAAVASYVSYAIGGHILLSYPSGRLRESRDRVLVALLYLGVRAGDHRLLLVPCRLWAGVPGQPRQCVPHHAERHARRGVQRRLVRRDGGVDGGDGAPVGPALARGDARLPSLPRAGLPDALDAGRVDHALVRRRRRGALHGRDETEPGPADPGQPRGHGGGGGILVVFLRTAAAGSAAGRLALDLDGAPLPAGRLEQAVRSALGDPDARLLFRDNAGTSWVDSQGVVVPPAEGRSITLFDGMSGSALEHDAAFDDDPAVVEAVGAVAGLALEAERLRVLLRAAGNRDRPQANGAPALRSLLTAREREVLALVAEGLTDGAIAQRLYLTRRTVETHLGHVFAKLGVPSGSSQNRRVHAVRRYLDAAELGANDPAP